MEQKVCVLRSRHRVSVGKLLAFGLQRVVVRPFKPPDGLMPQSGSPRHVADPSPLCEHPEGFGGNVRFGLLDAAPVQPLGSFPDLGHELLHGLRAVDPCVLLGRLLVCGHLRLADFLIFTLPECNSFLNFSFCAGESGETLLNR